MSAGLWEGMHLLDTAWSPDAGEDYHGAHVGMRRPGCHEIEWRPVGGSVQPAPVVSHTGKCRATVYELCSLGGGYFIRRTTRGPHSDQVAESQVISAGGAGALWFDMLRGRARRRAGGCLLPRKGPSDGPPPPRQRPAKRQNGSDGYG